MTILAVWALLLTASPDGPIPAHTVAAAGVVVKLGSASLEEYQHGDPARRVQLLRGN